MLHIKRYVRKESHKEHRVAIIVGGQVLGYVGLENVLSFTRANLNFDFPDDVTILREEEVRLTVSQGKKLGAPREAKRSQLPDEWQMAADKNGGMR